MTLSLSLISVLTLFSDIFSLVLTPLQYVTSLFSPYFNASLTDVDLKTAKKRLSHFLVVGINEAYDASVQLLLRLVGVTLRDDQIHLPASMTSTYSVDHEQLKARARLVTLFKRCI